MTSINNAMREMGGVIADPMWVAHAEVSKAAIERWRAAMNAVLVEMEQLRHERNRAYVTARGEVNRELTAAYAEIAALKGQIGVGRTFTVPSDFNPNCNYIEVERKRQRQGAEMSKDWNGLPERTYAPRPEQTTGMKSPSSAQSEREAFEAWARGRYSTRYIGMYMDSSADAYESTKLAEAAWDAWQARAACTAKEPK